MPASSPLALSRYWALLPSMASIHLSLNRTRCATLLIGTVAGRRASLCLRAKHVLSVFRRQARPSLASYSPRPRPLSHAQWSRPLLVMALDCAGQTTCPGQPARQWPSRHCSEGMARIALGESDRVVFSREQPKAAQPKKLTSGRY